MGKCFFLRLTESSCRSMNGEITVGVLALQGAFHEHIKLLNQATKELPPVEEGWRFREVRTPTDLDECDALIIPGGESTTVSLVAARSGLLEPLRSFVKYGKETLYARKLTKMSHRIQRKPTWGTCAGLILLAESANRTKKGGQELIGGLDVRVNRNYFGRQTESFETSLDLPFLGHCNGISKEQAHSASAPFKGVFIRAPVVERILPAIKGVQVEESQREGTVVAPSKSTDEDREALRAVEVMATLPGRSRSLKERVEAFKFENESGDIVAVRQGNVFGTSFHPELTEDARIHKWWLAHVKDAVSIR